MCYRVIKSIDSLKLPLELSFVAKNERLKQISELANNYGEQYDFSPSYIDIGISYSEVEELTILGHSLAADIEILEDIFELLVNLKRINLFVYDGEDYSEKKAILMSMSKCPICIKKYN
ncbi:hypothetical protein ACYSNU_00375 [Enterococcus sp. LJL120]